MPKTKVQKQETVRSLAAKLRGVRSLVFANFERLTTREIEGLRKDLKKEGVGYTVAKKTLLRLAFKEAGISVDPKSLKGNFATVIGAGDEVAPARILMGFRKQHEALDVLGGVLEGRLVSAVEMKALAALPSKPELLSRLVGSIQAPISGFVNVLAGNLRGLVGVLQAIKEIKT